MPYDSAQFSTHYKNAQSAITEKNYALAESEMLLAKQLGAEASSESELINLANVHFSLGIVYKAQQRFGDATDAYVQAFLLYQNANPVKMKTQIEKAYKLANEMWAQLIRNITAELRSALEKTKEPKSAHSQSAIMTHHLDELYTSRMQAIIDAPDAQKKVLRFPANFNKRYEADPIYADVSPSTENRGTVAEISLLGGIMQHAGYRDACKRIESVLDAHANALKSNAFGFTAESIEQLIKDLSHDFSHFETILNDQGTPGGNYTRSQVAMSRTPKNTYEEFCPPLANPQNKPIFEAEFPGENAFEKVVAYNIAMDKLNKVHLTKFKQDLDNLKTSDPNYHRLRHALIHQENNRNSTFPEELKDHPGRKYLNQIVDAGLLPADIPAAIRVFCEQLIDLLKNEKDPIKIVNFIIYDICRIHPFQNSNGRVARFLGQMVFMLHGLPSIDYGPSKAFYRAVEQQLYENIPLNSFLKKKMTTALAAKVEPAQKDPQDQNTHAILIGQGIALITATGVIYNSRSGTLQIMGPQQASSFASRYMHAQTAHLAVFYLQFVIYFTTDKTTPGNQLRCAHANSLSADVTRAAARYDSANCFLKLATEYFLSHTGTQQYVDFKAVYDDLAFMRADHENGQTNTVSMTKS